MGNKQHAGAIEHQCRPFSFLIHEISENRSEYNKHIDNLFVEVQKLKLLLENIESSADSLDGIASSLDRQVNIFTIGNDSYSDV